MVQKKVTPRIIFSHSPFLFVFGSWMEENQNRRSRMNIPDPQHWIYICVSDPRCLISNIFGHNRCLLMKLKFYWSYCTVNMEIYKWSSSTFPSYLGLHDSSSHWLIPVFRIRIQSGPCMDPDLDPGGQKLPQKIGKNFEVIDVLFWGLKVSPGAWTSIIEA